MNRGINMFFDEQPRFSRVCSLLWLLHPYEMHTLAAPTIPRS